MEKVSVSLLATGREYAIPIQLVHASEMWWVEEYVEHLGNFRPYFHLYANHKVVGAVAGIVVADDVQQFAYDHGLFVIVQSGELVEIANDEKFQPKLW